jgi:hypothetical protein
MFMVLRARTMRWLGGRRSLALAGGLNHSGVFRRSTRLASACLWARSLVGARMKRLVEFPLDQGGSVLIEVEELPAGPVVRGIGKDRTALVEEADKTFEDATAAVTPAARSLLARLRSIDDPPDEIGIVFGVQLSAQTGAFIASVAAQANFTVSMTWRRQGSGG